MLSVEQIFGKMLQTRFLIVFISVISEIYCQSPMYDDGGPIPVLDTRPATVVASVGETIILPCSVTNLGTYAISWFTAGYQPLTKNEQVLIDDARLSVKVIDDTEWNLQIKNARAEDSRTYLCMIQILPPQSKHVVLIVKAEPPSITEASFLPSITINEGKPLTITCATKGVPKPNVQWSNKRRLPDGSYTKELYQGGNLLTFNAVRRTDSGLYVCEAKNEMGLAKRDMKLIVNYEPTITMSTVPIPVKEGSDATMQCSAEGNPPPTMMWLRLNYRLTDSPKHRVVTYADSETQRTHVLTVKETEMEDAGKYRCFVRNTVGQTEESVNIIVIPTTSTSMSTTTTTTTTMTATMEMITTTEKPKTLPPLKPDELMKTTTQTINTNEKVYYNTPKTGETKNSSTSAQSSFVTLLFTVILLNLHKLS